ncbi:MAG TPA: glycerophosphodiester phosphodiesterase [Pseudomonadales bacterium]
MNPRARNWLLIFVTLALVLVFSRLAPERELMTRYFDGPRPLVIAHQGGDGLRPSNTLLAFQHAVDLGVDVLELDVHLTRDDAVVVMHDETVDRTTDGHGALAEMTLAEVKALDAAFHWPYQGDERPYRGRGVRVPTLAEVAERFPEMRLLIEIKPDSAEAGRAVCRELDRLGATDRVLVASFHAAPLEAFRLRCRTVPTSASEGEVRWFHIRYSFGLLWAGSTPMQAMQLPTEAGGRDLTDAGFLAAAHDRGLHIDYWTINEPARMRDLVARGADGIITDRPDLLLDVLERR